jgi:serine/threonine protein kinase
VIGHGSFGKVFRVLHKLEGYYYAVKKIKIEIPRNYDIRELDIFREISTMVNL